MKNKLTIISATKNCEKYIKDLIECLNNQTCKEFNWLVIDGGSEDATLNHINQYCDIPYKIINSKDYSIYHATNIGVENLETDYYGVAGADDLFDKNFVKYFYEAIEVDSPDLIFGAVIIGDRVVQAGHNLGWLKGMHGVGSSHSIGTIINKKLHNKFGLYSKLYPIVADQFFIKKCVYGGANVKRLNYVFGKYAITGFSSSNKIHYQLDFFKMQIETEKYFIIQYILFNLRLLKLFLLNK